MTTLSLQDIRHRMGVTQSAMAQSMGVPLRTYEDLEAGRSTVRPVHLQAARYAAVLLAPKSVDGALRLPPDVLEAVKTVVSQNEDEFR